MTDSGESDEDDLFDPNADGSIGQHSIGKQELFQHANEMGVSIADMNFEPTAADGGKKRKRSTTDDSDNETAIEMQRQRMIEDDPVYQFTELLAFYYPHRAINFWDRSSSRMMAKRSRTDGRLQDVLAQRLTETATGGGDINYYINNVYSYPSEQGEQSLLSPTIKREPSVRAEEGGLLSSAAAPNSRRQTRRALSIGNASLRCLLNGCDEDDENVVAKRSLQWLNSYSLLNGDYRLGALGRGVIFGGYRKLLINVPRFKCIHIKYFITDAVMQPAFAEFCAAIGNTNEIRGNVRYAASHQAQLAPRTVVAVYKSIAKGFFWDDCGRNFYTQRPLSCTSRRNSSIVMMDRSREKYVSYDVYANGGRCINRRYMRAC